VRWGDVSSTWYRVGDTSQSEEPLEALQQAAGGTKGHADADAERTPKAQVTLGEVGMAITPVVGKGPTNEKEARAFINSAKKMGRRE
jgi:hypothetical protein